MSSADRPVVRAASVFRLKPIARALSGLAGLMPVMVWAQLPVGADVVAGAATVTTPDVNHMLVQQGSAKAIINWQQFSIGEQGYVQFIQPGASAIALNRVVGADPSAILGKLSANGQVFLVNPNGVFFGAGAQVDVGGLVATTLDIANQDFLDGRFNFRKVPDHEGGATVVNAGIINTAKGGYVVLAGDYAANQGVIQTQAGTALLAAGNALTLQLSGSGLVDFAVDEAAVVELAGVENTGQILASGGRVIMTAKVANDLAATVVNNQGLIQAQSTVEKNGVVYLLGEGGNVANAGTIDASAQAGADGGYVEMRASGDVVHRSGSSTTVSGAATGHSDAGEVYTWADGSNRYEKGAHIEARGGAEGGDGGLVELSGNQVINRSLVDLRAPKGRLGTLLLDPTAIHIASGAGTDADAGDTRTIYEENLEAQLRMGNAVLEAIGDNASITLENLADNVLDGTTDDGTGGSLTLRTVGNNSSISMSGNDTIKVDRDLILTAENGSGGYTGTTIAAGTLIAGQGVPSGGGLNLADPVIWRSSLTLDAGTVSVGGNLILGRANIATNTDSAYTLSAHAHNGNLQIYGDVRAAVANGSAAAVATDVTLRADGGDVTVTGDVIANATGRGYYHYTWQTAGNNAPTYYGAQPWTLANQGEHAIDSKLNIQAGGNVSIGGAVDVRAIDQSSNFAGNGGSYQNPTATQHVFWRATAADAAATIEAGGNVGIGGATSVVADGYANASYGETESWSAMVNQVNLIAQYQQIYQTRDPETGQWINPQSQQVTTTGKGSNTGSYTWSQSGMNASGSGPYSSPNLSSWSTGSSGTQDTVMSYENQPGLTATLAISAGGDVTLNGIDNRAVNRSNTSGGSFTDANWGYQNTAGAALNVSSSIERRYGDSFTTSFTAAPATATTTISAGDNRSVTLNGGGASYLVEAQHTALTASGNSIAHASMTVTAGSAGGASGNGQITLAGPITVRGASSNEVHLTVTNHDGAISHADGAGTLAVNNQYSSGVARAAFTSGAAGIDLGTVTVNAGHTGHFTADATGDIDITSASVTAGNTGNFTTATDGDIDIASATVTAGNTGNFTATAGGDIDIGSVAVTGTSNNGNITVDADGGLNLGTSSINAGQMGNFTATSGAVMTVGGIGISAGHTAKLVADSGDTLLVTGVLSASGNRRGEVDIDADGDITVNSGASVTATSSSGYEGYPSTLWRGTSVLDINGLADVLLNGSVTSTAHGTATANVRGGGQLTIGAGTTTQAFSRDLNATLGVTGGGGLLVNGNATAAASAGVATATLNTSNTSTAGITQGSASTITATGQTAALTIQAGATSSDNAAALNLGGTVRAQSTTGTATLAVHGAHGSINHFSATSGGNAASATLTGYNATNALTLTGTGTVTGNADSGSGAQLSVTGVGDIAAGGSTLQVRNNNSGALAGANAAFSSGHGVGLGGVQASTAGNGAVSVSAAAGNGDMTAAGAITATAQGGNASVALAGTGETRVNAVSAASTGGTASIALNGLNGLEAQGDLSATSGASTASVQLTSNEDAVTTVDGTTLTVNGATGATLQVQGADIDLLGNAALTAGSNNATATLTSAGDVTVDGNLFVTATTGNATLTVDSDGALTVDSEGDLRAVAGGSTATVTLTGATGMQLDGDALAQANAGNATLTLFTDGGSDAGIGQGGDSVLRAQGISASLALGAGAAANAVTSANAAAFDLQGALQAQASGGTASLAVAGAGGTVNDFSATSTNDTASVNIAALVADELLELTGIGTVSGHDNSTTGGGLSVASAGALDARLASLTITNTNNGAAAGARAGLSAAGLLQLGDVAVSTSGDETAAIHASGETVAVDGALSTSALAGGSTIDLIALAGDITTTADASATANAQSGTAAIVLNAVTGIDNQGAISADSTGGAGSVIASTSGGPGATVSQGAGGSINASGALGATVSIQAGGSIAPQAAALDLDGSITADASAGDARLTIQGSGGRIGAFEVTAAGNAGAELTTHASAGQLVLDGEGLVRGNSDAADGAALTVNAAGSLDASAANLTVSNLNTGADAGATATFDAGNGAAQLGGVTVSSLGNGLASLDAQATGALGATNVSASGRTASVTLNGGGDVSLGDVTATASSTASIAATSSGGNVTQLTGSELNATSSTDSASIDLDAAGAVELRNAGASGTQAAFNAIARNGTLGQAAGSTVQANGSTSATVDLTSSGAMTLDGSVLAFAINGVATTTLDAASITQGASGAITADGSYASATVDADGAVALGGLLRVNGAHYAAANVEGGSIQLNGLDIDSGEDAVATLTSAGNIALNGNATIDGGESANFTATAQNGILSQAAGASLRVGAGSGDGTVTLSSSGAMTLNGSVQSASTHGSATTGLQAASISQGANGSIGASGTQATTTLTATGALDLGGLLRANATAGHASVTAQGAGIRAHGIDVDATHRASATLTSTGAVSLTGNAAIDGGESADFTATAQHGTLSQAAGASLRAGAINGTAAVALTSSSAMALDGSVLANSTNGNATTELDAASISQGANGTIGADGATAATTLEAIGSLTLDGLLRADATAGDATLTVSGAVGRVHDIGVKASGTATARLDTTGDLALTGDAVAVNGKAGALLEAAANGNLTQQAGSHLTAGATAGTARIALQAGGALTLRDATADGAQAEIAGTAGGALGVAAGATQQATAGSGNGSVLFTSTGAMTIDGDVFANSANAATVALDSGAGGFNQGADSIIRSTGNAASTRIDGGALAVNGLLQAQGGTLAALQVQGGSGNIHHFDVAAGNGQAVATFGSTGALVLDGNGNVSGNQDDALGAVLKIDAAAELDTRGATLTVDNRHHGAQAGARTLLTSGGDLHGGAISVAAAGGEDAILALLAGGALEIANDLLATAHNAGNGQGGALIDLRSGQFGNASGISQSAGSRIAATSGGNAAGDATVLMKAGHCCDGEVTLLGTTTAQVSGGEGNATVRVHGGAVAVQDLTAKVDANGMGDTLIALAAPTTVTVNGMLDSQAASSAAIAGITLVTDKLDYRANKATLSKGNGRVQLAPFNTTYMIGVESEPDFDATPAVNYNMALLRKFDGNDAELVFGGAYDRSSWLDANGNSCVPGMDQWTDMGQHTGEIHVAGAGVGQLRFAASRMVFDTTGTTYYHDNQMTPWSVPTGRTAIYVPPPTVSLDRYLDRTDNSIQTSLFGVQNATAPTLQVRPLPQAPEGTVPIAGDMFMAGDGVNLSRVDVAGAAPAAGGAGADAGSADSGSSGSGSSGSGNNGSGKANAGSSGQGAADQSNSDSSRPDSTRPDEDDDDDTAAEV